MGDPSPKFLQALRTYAAKTIAITVDLREAVEQEMRVRGIGLELDIAIPAGPGRVVITTDTPAPKRHKSRRTSTKGK